MFQLVTKATSGWSVNTVHQCMVLLYGTHYTMVRQRLMARKSLPHYCHTKSEEVLGQVTWKLSVETHGPG